ncbi:DNA-binding protein [Enterococcus villorum]|uniref:DNA-binding protein n=1 Tax=Enterococcus villorum TaxID=112904 RepID=A0A1V8YAH8_9ENTE|nr:PAS domain-containing protein [Enterococcus villorum]OQO69296.1 DNA-binding protein [Enterococcus villorum]OQO71824.1 DNA-binding protein [Enterococcus villorum]
MDKNQLALYISLVKFLGQALGENYEVVLHHLEKGHFHIAAIENNHISGRDIDSPVTGFALEIIRSKKYLKQDYVVNYDAQTSNGKKLKGATFFIRNHQNELVGLLCINQDISKYQALSKEILSLVGLTSETPITPAIDTLHVPESVEILEETIEGIIYSVVSPDLLNQQITLNKDLKVEIIRQLNEKGIFQIKGAVSQVAKVLNISDPSVYRYLKMADGSK